MQFHDGDRCQAHYWRLLCGILGLLCFLLEEFLLRGGEWWRDEFECQLADGAGEPERRLIVMVIDAGARVRADVKGFVRGRRERDAVGDRFGIDVLAIHREHALAALAKSRPLVALEVENNGVFAGSE